MPALFAYALHGGVGKAVVGLASIAAPTAHRGEGHKVVQLRTGFPGRPRVNMSDSDNSCAYNHPRAVQKTTDGTASLPRPSNPAGTHTHCERT